MQTVRCADCGADYSSHAAACPRCGCPAPKQVAAAGGDRERRVQQFLMMNGKYFSDAHKMQLRRQLMTVSESAMQGIECLSFSDPTLLLVISFFVGEFGVDRFMLGQVVLGLLKFFVPIITCGIGYVWWLVDLFLIYGATRDCNFEKVMKVIQYS